MIEAQLGEAAFLDFTRGWSSRSTRWRVLQAPDFRARTGGVHRPRLGRVLRPLGLRQGADGLGGRGRATVEQLPARSTADRVGRSYNGDRSRRRPAESASITEPTIARRSRSATATAFVRVPGRRRSRRCELRIEHVERRRPAGRRTGGGSTSTLPFEPEQVAVDPDSVLLDANPGNNVWKSTPRSRVTPLYTMLDETDLTSDYDRWNFTAGPWIVGAVVPRPVVHALDDGRAAGRREPAAAASAAGPTPRIRTDYRDLVLGADATVLGDHLRERG